MSGELTKSVKKQLRDLVYAAHAKALWQPLQDLGLHFDRWQQGEIDAIELADRTREFNDGPSRDIYKRFTWRRNDDLARLVACGIYEGNLDETAVPVEVKSEVDRWLAFLRSP